MSHWIDTVFMRGGTSKGLFFAESDLPEPGSVRDALFATAMGSPDPFGRQLDGMGGGVSSMSKVVSVTTSAQSGVDLEYTFGQVAVRTSAVDYSGNCGNLTSAVVPFALEAGVIEIDEDGPATVRLLNVNTDKLIDVRLHVSGGRARIDGDLALPGVAGTDSPIELRFLDPAGAATGVLLPTGRPVDTVSVGSRSFEVSLVDAANPMVFVRARDLGLVGDEAPNELSTRVDTMRLIDEIRRAGAVAMGLCTSADTAPLAVPKLALVAPPGQSTLLDGSVVEAGDCDVLARVISMEQPHQAIPGTAALCLAAAARIPGSIVHDLVDESIDQVRIATPSGVVTTTADVVHSPDGLRVASTSLFRTARPLMRGQVAVPSRGPTPRT